MILEILLIPTGFSKLAGSYINGVQSTGVVAAIKHFVCNDLEHERYAVNVVISQRALREIYLLPFQIAIAESSPGALMTAYNRVNGTHASENSFLIEDILRKEWKWKGLVMSDWYVSRLLFTRPCHQSLVLRCA